MATTNTHSLDLESGSSQYASITDASQTGLDITGDMTLEAWVKVESALASDENRPIIVKYLSSGNQRGYSINYESAGGTKYLRALMSSDGSTASDKKVAATLVVGQWHHVAMAYDASAGSIEFYLDGVSKGTATSAPTSIFNNTSDVEIGKLDTTYWDGLIDDVRMWNDVRTQTEIRDNAGIELIGTEANLQGYWKLNNGYTDETANGNDLTAGGSPVFSTVIPWEEATGISGSTNLETNLISHYELDSDVTDSKGTNNGTANTLSYTTGKQNNCITQTDGSSRGVDLGTPTSLDFSTYPLAIGSWFKTSFNVAQDNGHMIMYVSTMTSSPWHQYALEMTMSSTAGDRGKIKGIYRNATVYSVESSTTYNDGAWHYAVMTIASDGTLSLFVDGILIGTTTTSGTINTGKKSLIGTNWDELVGGVWVGELDEVSIYQRGLHYGDVLDLYNAGVGIPYESGVAYTQVLTETITLVSVLSLETGKALGEVLTLVASINNKTTRVIKEAIALVDTVGTVKIATQVLSEAITLVETVVTKITAMLLTETITLVDTLATKISALRLTETVTVGDALTTVQTFFRSFTETITLSATLAKVLTATQSLVETLALNDRLYGLLNGVSMKYVDQYVSTVGEYVDQYFDR